MLRYNDLRMFLSCRACGRLQGRPADREPNLVLDHTRQVPGKQRKHHTGHVYRRCIDRRQLGHCGYRRSEGL